MKSWALLSSNLPSVKFSERHISKKKTVTTGWMENWALSVNDAQFVSVDLIGEKDQVI